MASGNIANQGVKYKEVTLTVSDIIAPNTSNRFWITYDASLYNSKLIGVELIDSNLGTSTILLNAIGITKDPTVSRICIPIYNNHSSAQSVSSVTLRIYYI